MRTPTTEEVRNVYAHHGFLSGPDRLRMDEFDRWLAQHDAEVAAAKPKPRGRVDKIVEPFHPSTGDTRLDAWMRASRERRGAPKPPRAVPAPAFPYGLKVMNKDQRREAMNFANAAVKAWRALGHEVVVSKLEHSRFDGEVAIDWRNVRVLPLVP